uniref:secoisolariciresinol dehydrogenase-like n=1 Tax=Erigeron canadensis TaxID=72917 RepID=UPI001CB93C1C|nr:secoisolariciresinol dehydrogenase-like [Erigeron canadensis]
MATMNIAPVSGASTPQRLLANITSGAESIRACSRELCIESGKNDVLASSKSYVAQQLHFKQINKIQRLRSTLVRVHNHQSIRNSLGNDEHGATTRLAGKVAIITGAAQGIGECTARLFAKHGAKIVIVDIQDDLGQSVCEDIGLESASYIHCDVTKEEDIEKAVKFTIEKYGKLDIMINNAAVLGEAKQSILENSKADFDHVISVNLAGVFLGTKHAARAMIPAHSGSIISVGSVSSAIGGVSPHAYTSSKHAIIGLTRNVAAELGKHGIRVNCVSPYLIPPSVPAEITDTYPDIFKNIYSNIKGVTLQGEDVAQAALYLASDDSKYISGHNLAVDGGFTTINPGFGLYAPSKSS